MNRETGAVTKLEPGEQKNSVTGDLLAKVKIARDRSWKSPDEKVSFKIIEQGGETAAREIPMPQGPAARWYALLLQGERRCGTVQIEVLIKTETGGENVGGTYWFKCPKK